MTGAGASDLLHAEDTGVEQMITGETSVAARSPLQLFWRRLRRDRVAMVAGAFIIALILVAIFAGVITKVVGAPAPNVQQTSALDDFGLPSGPSSEHLFGVDPIGRDVFSRVLYGARVSLKVAFIGTGLSVLFGIFWGTIAGFFRGFIDTAISRTLDVLLAFPVLLLGLGLATACSGQDGCAGGLIQPGLSVVIFIIVVANTPYVARIIRGQVLSLREKEFVEAARSQGASKLHLVLRHILPNALGPVIVASTIEVSTAIIAESTLSFLGLGFPPDIPTWGRILFDAKDHLEFAPHWALFPGAAIFLTVLSINFVGDGLRDALDPRRML